MTVRWHREGQNHDWRLLMPNFCTDGRGYADDGRAWWEDEHKYSGGDESEAEEEHKGMNPQ